MKNPLTPAGIERATFRFVAQHLNHCATADTHKVVFSVSPAGHGHAMQKLCFEVMNLYWPIKEHFQQTYFSMPCKNLLLTAVLQCILHICQVM